MFGFQRDGRKYWEESWAGKGNSRSDGVGDVSVIDAL